MIYNTMTLFEIPRFKKNTASRAHSQWQHLGVAHSQESVQKTAVENNISIINKRDLFITFLYHSSSKDPRVVYMDLPQQPCEIGEAEKNVWPKVTLEASWLSRDWHLDLPGPNHVLVPLYGHGCQWNCFAKECDIFSSAGSTLIA